MSISAQLDEAVAHLQSRSAMKPAVGIVLGSGLGTLVDAVTVDARVPFSEIPHFPQSTVEGHAGELVVGSLAGVPVAVMAGRVHAYEGYAPDQVVFPVRVLVRLGAKVVIITNASGGVNPNFKPRDLMVIRDQLNLTGRNPLVGPNDPALGVRFPDMTTAFDPELASIVHDVATAQGLTLRDGVYAGLLGPSFETPAEIRMLQTLGADAVGMSTVYEVIAARHMGARVLGVSCITNAAAGLSAVPLSHEDVKEVGAAIRTDFTRLITDTVGRLQP